MKILGFFTHNLGIKFLALILASAFWIYVATGEAKTQIYPAKIPIIPKNLENGLAAVYDQDETMVKIMATSSAWSELTVDSFVAYVDLGDKTLGTYEVDVIVTCSVPGVQIVDKDPAKILVRIEPEITAQVPVAGKIEGTPAKGFKLGQLALSPIEVEARGAKSLITSTFKAVVQINVDGASSSIEKDYKIVALQGEDKIIRTITFSPEKVKVNLPISKEGEGKIVGIKVKTKGDVASGFWIDKIELTPETVNIVGDKELISGIDYLETEEIDIAGINGKKEYNSKLVLPGGVSLAAGEPAEVKVTFSVASEDISRQVVAGFAYQGLDSGITIVNLSPAEMKVVVVGPAGSLRNLSSGNVVVNLNLGGKSAGSYSINISKSMISVPPGCSVASFVPSRVTVTIQ